MKIFKDMYLKDFEFWNDAADNVAKLTDEELDQLEDILSYKDEFWNATELNDLFRFEFATVCEWLGLDYDDENDTFRRE